MEEDKEKKNIANTSFYVGLAAGAITTSLIVLSEKKLGPERKFVAMGSIIGSVLIASVALLMNYLENKYPAKTDK